MPIFTQANRSYSSGIRWCYYERYACGNITKEEYALEKNSLSAREEELKAQYVMAEQKQALLKEKIRMSADQILAIEKVARIRD